jgi:succinate dehydrogenase / fumarate reductase, cytochrome b subunit
MASRSRPLSPHLQIYRLPLTVVLSISHRITGVFLVLGVLLFVALLVSAAASPQAFEAVHRHVASWYGQLILFLSTFALFFHFCNGVRHLGWDAGYGYEYPTVNITAYIALGATVVLTLLVWIVAFAAGGGQ